MIVRVADDPSVLAGFLENERAVPAAAASRRF
jgi:hypothetical protein